MADKQTKPTTNLATLAEGARAIRAAKAAAAQGEHQIAVHHLPMDADEAAAELISILSTKSLEGTSQAFAALTKANETAGDPQAIRRTLGRQVPILEALENRLILSAFHSKPEASVRYVATALATHAALVKVLGALYETREVKADA